MSNARLPAFLFLSLTWLTVLCAGPAGACWECVPAGANQAVAAAQSGADVRFVGRIGEDGRWLLDELQRRRVHTELVAVDTTEVQASAGAAGG